MNKAVTVFGLVFLSNLSFAQLPMEVKISENHLSKIEEISSTKEKLKLYRKFYRRDSASQAKQLEKLWQHRSDSLAAAMQRQDLLLSGTKLSKRDLRKLEKASRKFNLPENSSIKFPDNALVAGKIKEKVGEQVDASLPLDSATLKKEGLSLIEEKVAGSNIQEVNKLKGQADQYKGDLSKYKGKLDIHKNDSLIKSELKSEAVHRGQEQLENVREFKAIQDYKRQADSFDPTQSEYKKQADQFQDSTYRKEQAKKKAEEAAFQYISENPAIMKAAKAKTDLLMKKYSIVPNSNDLSTAVKRTSLEGKSFRERLYLAGNFQVLSFKPFAFDFSPMIGYRFSTKLIGGVGGNYRKTFGDSLASVSADMLGYKAFVSYDVFRNLFAYSEFANNSTGVVYTEDGTKRNWSHSFLMGAGRKFTLHPKVEMTVFVLYNFTHEPDNQIYSNPWTMRFGFQLSNLALIKRKPEL